jgi:tetrahydromethanopterin S-methyltransferase subunit H
MNNIVIKDRKGRIVFESKGSRFILSRFIDMDKETKNAIMELYIDLTGETKENIINFLDFKTQDIQEEIFCS